MGTEIPPAFRLPLPSLPSSASAIFGCCQHQPRFPFILLTRDLHCAPLSSLQMPGRCLSLSRAGNSLKERKPTGGRVRKQLPHTLSPRTSLPVDRNKGGWAGNALLLLTVFNPREFSPSGHWGLMSTEKNTAGCSTTMDPSTRESWSPEYYCYLVPSVFPTGLILPLQEFFGTSPDAGATCMVPDQLWWQIRSICGMVGVL